MLTSHMSACFSSLTHTSDLRPATSRKIKSLLQRVRSLVMPTLYSTVCETVRAHHRYVGCAVLYRAWPRGLRTLQHGTVWKEGRKQHVEQSRSHVKCCCQWEGVAHRVRTVREHSTVRTVNSCGEQRMYVSDVC